ncbi:MCL1-like protein [Mya arenaria]|uniref:MCL1-like protein n=1 Tax=Mya arenaria TaxID=6604 RepID=A0ABY7DV75_MYAAR|nr:bcl-2-related protein A1-like [Mya arenaria]WAQ98840.1 MCL1-like protein [Mya arenaria]
MTATSPTYGGMKTISGTGVLGKNSNNLFTEIHKKWGLLPGNQGLNNIEQSSQTSGSSMTPLESVRKEAEVIAFDIVQNIGLENQRKSPNRFCKTMRKTVKEVSDRHDIVLKSMVNKLNIDDGNMFQTFIHVADEIFEDGQINWGRIIVVYAFAARLTSHFRKQNTNQDDKIALFVGKYVGNKLGRWILDNHGWEGFADYFSDESNVEDKVWKGLLYTATLGGLGALAAIMGR